MSKIRIANGPYRGREKSLSTGPMTIGRDAEAGIQILDRSASRFHAEIFPVGGMYFVRDLDSKNGTYVNDEKIGDEELLREGDVIKIGSTELVYESGAALTDDEPSDRIAYRDDPDLLSNTLEFRLDELSDIAEQAKEPQGSQDHARSLRMLYQIGRLLSEGYNREKEMKVLDLLVGTMPAETALIFRREGESGKLVPSTMRTVVPTSTPVISRSIIRKTFSENKALHIANAQDDDRFDRTASVIQKGIRTVICVPLVVGGQTRGVLYVSRGAGHDSFDQIDLELVSACAIQLGMAQHAHEQERRRAIALWKALSAMVRTMEAREGLLGSGERCARVCAALAGAMGLDSAAKERITRAGLLHHLPRLSGEPIERCIGHFDGVDDLEDVLALVRSAVDRSSGGVSDVEANILGIASAFEAATSADPDADVDVVIDRLSESGTFDAAVTGALHGCHLSGALYTKRDKPAKG
jgi:pSer/pThr/pTyr-binding forkhead associated (FHA) protein